MGAMNNDEELAADPCCAKSTFSSPRFLAFALLFVAMLGAGPTLLFILADTPYGVQIASAISYTAAVMLYGFAKNRNGIKPYLFTCPVVVNQYPRLIKRHLAFLAALLVFETISLGIKPYLSSWWLTSSGRGAPPIAFVVAVPCMILAVAGILTNRSLLEHAHDDRLHNNL